MNEYDEPEVLTQPIESVLLRLKAFSGKSESVYNIFSECLQSPGRDAIHVGLKDLYTIGTWG